jgi:hypothetical protein
MKPSMSTRARLPALLLAAALGAAVESPTEAEWAPVARSLAAGADEAVAGLEAITAKYPKWPDGHRALASARLRAGDHRGAWKSARAAIALDKADSAAAVLGMQALGILARYDDAYTVADLFTDASDPGGAVAAQAAITALMARNDRRLADYLTAAEVRANGRTPMLDFITAKQAQRAKDLPAAVAALERAIAAKADYRDAHYELGRVLTVQALQAPELAEALLGKADAAFSAAARLDRQDADCRLGLGRARLELGKRLLAAGKTDAGGVKLREAVTALDEGLQLDPGNRDGKLWKGDAQLRLGRYDEAALLLKQAFNAGAIDRALPFNLSLALSRSGKPDEAAKVLENVEAQSDDERLTLAISAFNLGNWSAAQKLLTDVRDNIPVEPPEEAKRRWAVYRYLGHCARELAAGAAGEQREELLATAAMYYKEAGENGDVAARHWYLHHEAQRGPLQAFEAGRQSIKWYGMWNPPAWKLLAGNYGYKVSRGEGFAGAWKHSKAHLMLWTLLTFIPIGLFLKGWLLPNGLYGGGGPKPAPKPPTRPAAKPGTAAARRPAPAPRKPIPGARPPSNALAPKSDASGPKTPSSE